MKVAEAKPIATPAKAQTSFFNKGVEPSFFNGSVQRQPFFKKENIESNIQTKLRVGQVNDSFEKEADNTADKVLQKLSNQKSSFGNQKIPIDHKISAYVQRKCTDCEKELTKNTDDIESGLSASKGTGRPMSGPILKQMESSFGADFSSVRIHDNNLAIQMCSKLNAQAFAHGNDIYFNGNFQTAFNNLKTYCLARRSAGWNKIVVLTCPPRGQNSDVDNQSVFNQKLVEYNNLLKLNYKDFSDEILKLDEDVRFQDFNNTQFFDADKVHYNSNGYGIISSLIKKIILR